MNTTITQVKQAAACAPATNKAVSCIPPQIIWFNRVVLFLVFFWFGLLKVLSISPAEALVLHLHQETIGHLMPANQFVFFLGLVECVIGLVWLMPRFTKYALLIFLVQMFTTFLPLVFLPEFTWEGPFVLSLTGQYIVKNLVLVASAFTIYTDCRMQGWKLLNG